MLWIVCILWLTDACALLGIFRWQTIRISSCIRVQQGRTYYRAVWTCTSGKHCFFSALIPPRPPSRKHDKGGKLCLNYSNYYRATQLDSVPSLHSCSLTIASFSLHPHVSRALCSTSTSTVAFPPAVWLVLVCFFLSFSAAPSIFHG